jgi:hypothetical protein
LHIYHTGPVLAGSVTVPHRVAGSVGYIHPRARIRSDVLFRSSGLAPTCSTTPDMRDSSQRAVFVPLARDHVHRPPGTTAQMHTAPSTPPAQKRALPTFQLGRKYPESAPAFCAGGAERHFFFVPGRPFGPWWGPTIPAQNMPNFWVKSSDCRLGVLFGLPWPDCGGRPCGRSVAGAGSAHVRGSSSGCSTGNVRRGFCA